MNDIAELQPEAQSFVSRGSDIGYYVSPFCTL